MTDQSRTDAPGARVGADGWVAFLLVVALAGIALRARPEIGRRYREAVNARRRDPCWELRRPQGPRMVNGLPPGPHAVGDIIVVEKIVPDATVDLAEPATVEVDVADPTEQTEQLLSEVLADVLGLETVSATSDFFDDLGADSMVMALFCARLRKREGLPRLSIKEVYQSPTIAGLARAITTGESDSGPTLRPGPEPVSAGPARSTEAAPPVATWQFVLCGAAQLLIMVGLALMSAVVLARGYGWISTGSGPTGIYLRLVLFGGALFLGSSILPIVLKWALIGRWRPEQFRVWSPRYIVFWFVRFLIQTNPLVLFVGSPIYVLYLRALGANIGRGVVILSRGVPVCTDLLEVGDHTIIRKNSHFSCYRAHAGLIQTGPVRIGRDAFVGEATVLDIDTMIGDRAQLGHSSALHAGQSVPAGEHRVGSPAEQHTVWDYRAVAPAARSAARGVAYSVAEVLVLFAVGLPLLFAIPMLGTLPISSAVLENVGPWPFSDWTFYGEALIVSLVVFLGVSIVGLALVGTLPRLLNRAIKPGEVYPLYGYHYWIHRTITRLTNVPFFTNLFGDTSYVLHYLSWLGYDVSFDEQTGANFGLNVRHDNPYAVSIGAGTMAADGLSIVNTDYSNTSFRVSPVTIGAHSFLGNNIAYPSQGKTGENCLHATKVMVPIEGEVREDVGFLGSPSFEIPRMVLRDRKFDEIKDGDEFGRRLAAKNRHNIATMGLFLLVRWVPILVAVLLIWSAVILHQRLGVWVTVVPLLVAPVVAVGYNVLVERAAVGFRRFRPAYCSMYDLESWQIERYWKLSWQPILLNGTPFKSIAWRLLGVRIGKRVFDDGCLMIDKTMITVGDHCMFNAGSVIQPHSQEDGTFKSDRVTIGDGCTLGPRALVHYGVTMGAGSTLAADSFLMKGAVVPPHSRWGDNPAREIGDDDRAGAAMTALATLRPEALLTERSTEVRSHETANTG